MSHNTRQVIEFHYAAYEAYAEFAAASMTSLMSTRSWKQLQKPETIEEVCALANDYALEMMSHRAKELESLDDEVH